MIWIDWVVGCFELLEPTMEVVRLQYIGAAETAEIVNDLISTAGGDESPTRVIADERLNALIVYGDEVSRKHIHDLLVALDQAPQR